MGFDDLGIVEIVRGALCSSELFLLFSHRKGIFSVSETWLFCLSSPDVRNGGGRSLVSPVRAAEVERLGTIAAVVGGLDGLRTFILLPPRVAR